MVFLTQQNPADRFDLVDFDGYLQVAQAAHLRSMFVQRDLLGALIFGAVHRIPQMVQHALPSTPAFIAIEILINHFAIILQAPLALTLLHFNGVGDAIIVPTKTTTTEAHFLQHGESFAIVV